MIRPAFFEMTSEIEAFEHSLSEFIGLLKRDGMAERISHENIQRFMHGRRWSYRANQHAEDSKMHTASVEWQIPFKEIADGDLTLIARTVRHITDQMHSNQMRIMYQVMSESCDKHGQTVSVAKEGSNAQAFLEMLRRIEFSVNKDGTVSMPEIHASPDTAAAMIADLESQPPEFALEVENIKKEKTRVAINRESKRRARFKKAHAE